MEGCSGQECLHICVPLDVRESDVMAPEVVEACLPSTVTRYIPITHWPGVYSHLTYFLPPEVDCKFLYALDKRGRLFRTWLRPSCSLLSCLCVLCQLVLWCCERWGLSGAFEE